MRSVPAQDQPAGPDPTPAERNRVEATWLERASRGDERSFEALFRAYVEPLCAYAYSFVESQSTAQDIVQDLFARLWEGRGGLATPRNVRAYLYGATRNRAINHLRSRQAELTFQRRAMRDEVARDEGRQPVPPEDDLHAHALAEAIERATQALPPRCREALILTRDQHLSYAEAAEVLHVAPKTIEVHVWRALGLLRRALGDWLHQD